MKKTLSVIIISAIVALVWWQSRPEPSLIQVELPGEQNYNDFVFSEEVEEPSVEGIKIEDIADEPIVEEEETKEDKSVVNKSVNLNIPFTSQAPTANWDQPFQDACEEASILMVDYYYQNKNLPGPEEVEDILTEMINVEVQDWGSHFNLPVAKLGEFAEKYFNYKAKVIEDLDADKIREYLDQGIPVIVPADGKRLANPYFSNGGPEYHMLVIKGYVDDNFITNDPGTKRGKDFIYSADNLLSSIADWDRTLSDTNSIYKRGLVLLK